MFRDASGDIGVENHDWLDITEVHLKVRKSSVPLTFNLILAGAPALPLPPPAKQWIAYGVVADTNGDGSADVRVGMDNTPGNQHREWLTDLVTGETVAAGPPYGRMNFDTYYPGEGAGSVNRALFWGGRIGSGEHDLRFYAWASLIEGGRVVATDYAPDTGWLEEGQQPELPLVGTDWRIEHELRPSSAGHSRTQIQRILFLVDGRISFVTGCKTGHASAEVGLDTLRVTDMDLTEFTCTSEVAELDRAFMALLSADEIRYAVDGGILTLGTGRDSVRLVGAHEGDPAPGVIP